MYNFPAKPDDKSMNYLYNYKYKVDKLNEAYNNSDPLKIQISNKLGDTDNDINISVQGWISETAKTWGFDPFTKNKKNIENALYSTLKFSNSLKGNKVKKMSELSVSNEGDEFSSSLFTSEIHSNINIIDIDKNFKFFLLGLSYVLNKLTKDLDNMHLRVLYMQLISNSNTYEVYKLKNLNPDMDYVKNSQSVSKLINFYYSKKGFNGLDEVKNLTEEYLRSAQIPKEISNINSYDFYEYIRIMLVKLANINILNKNEYLNTDDIVNEINEIAKILPIEKFDSDFIKECPTLEEWVNLDIESFKKSYENIPKYKVPALKSIRIENAKIEDDLIELDPMTYMPTLYFNILTGNNSKLTEIYNTTKTNILKTPKYYNCIKEINDMEFELNIIFDYRSILDINLSDNDIIKSKELYSRCGSVDNITRDYIKNLIMNKRLKRNRSLYNFIKKYNINTNHLANGLEFFDQYNDDNIKNNVYMSKFNIPEIIKLSNSSTGNAKDSIITENFIIITKSEIMYPKLDLKYNQLLSVKGGLEIR